MSHRLNIFNVYAYLYYLFLGICVRCGFPAMLRVCKFRATVAHPGPASANILLFAAPRLGEFPHRILFNGTKPN